MTWTKRVLAGLCVAAVASLSCSREQQASPKAEPPAAIAEALSWLPKETETVMVLNAKYKIKHDYPEGDLSALEACSNINMIGVPQELRLLDGVTADWIVSGTRNYRPAGGIGICPFEGCKIIALSEEDLADAAAKLTEVAEQQIKLLDHSVWVYREVQVPDTWSYYITIHRNHLFIATDKKYLEEVLTHIAAPNKAPVHTTMGLWKYIDAQSPFWSVRAFTKRSNQLSYGMNMGDAGLRGYAIQLDRAGKILSITQSTESAQGNQRARLFWGNMETPKRTSPDFSDVGPDLRITFGPDEEDWGSIAFFLLAAVGHTVFL